VLPVTSASSRPLLRVSAQATAPLVTAGSTAGAWFANSDTRAGSTRLVFTAPAGVTSLVTWMVLSSRPCSLGVTTSVTLIAAALVGGLAGQAAAARASRVARVQGRAALQEGKRVAAAAVILQQAQQGIRAGDHMRGRAGNGAARAVLDQVVIL